MHTIVSLIFDSKFSDNTHFYPVLVFVYYMRKNTRDFNDIRLLRVAVKRLTYHTHTHEMIGKENSCRYFSMAFFHTSSFQLKTLAFLILIYYKRACKYSTHVDEFL